MRTSNLSATLAPVCWMPPRPLPATSPARVRIEQSQRGEEACFMTEKRLTCGDSACELRVRCRRLVAVWKR
ncbi:MAG: hypothetical protein HYR49_06040 [Gammaproteobacteria bacterium]|nr:hypothetical protein [Gammaproteobacteria bacterium]